MERRGAQIGFQDFIPEYEEKRGLIFKDVYWQSFATAVDKANTWIAENQVRVLNVETVVLPNIWDSDEEGTEDGKVGTSGESSSEWYQFVRVWYTAEA